jgi:hypothetical protein
MMAWQWESLLGLWLAGQSVALLGLESVVKWVLLWEIVLELSLAGQSAALLAL